MTPRRLFACVLVATLALDFVNVVVFHHRFYTPAVVGTGRWMICVLAGYGASRGGAPLLGMAHTLLGATVATVLSAAVYVVTGAAFAATIGPAIVYALIVATTVIAVTGSLIGTGAEMLLHKRFRLG